MLNHKRKLEEAARRLEDNVKLLQEAVTTDWTDCNRAAGILNEVAEWQAYTRIMNLYGSCLEDGDDHKKATLLCTDYVIRQGVDDTWSGRSNDVRRAAHDGRQAALSDMLFHCDND